MAVETTPFRWPEAWKDPARVALLEGTPFNCIVIDRGVDREAIAAQARRSGLAVADVASPPQGVRVASGVWPGVQMGRAAPAASAGPTGNPWVDSNGWLARLEASLHPGSSVWIEAAPKEASILPSSYLVAVADSAARVCASPSGVGSPSVMSTKCTRCPWPASLAMVPPMPSS